MIDLLCHSHGLAFRTKVLHVVVGILLLGFYFAYGQKAYIGKYQADHGQSPKYPVWRVI